MFIVVSNCGSICFLTCVLIPVTIDDGRIPKIEWKSLCRSACLGENPWTRLLLRYQTDFSQWSRRHCYRISFHGLCLKMYINRVILGRNLLSHYLGASSKHTGNWKVALRQTLKQLSSEPCTKSTSWLIRVLIFLTNQIYLKVDCDWD